MFIAIYRFQIHTGMETEFIQAWKNRTEGVYFELGSLGSRLHREEKTGDFIAYAQWPTRAQWENVNFKILNTDLFPRYKDSGPNMTKTIKHSETILELEVEADYLHSLPFNFL